MRLHQPIVSITEECSIVYAGITRLSSKERGSKHWGGISSMTSMTPIGTLLIKYCRFISNIQRKSNMLRAVSLGNSRQSRGPLLGTPLGISYLKSPMEEESPMTGTGDCSTSMPQNISTRASFQKRNIGSGLPI